MLWFVLVIAAGRCCFLVWWRPAFRGSGAGSPVVRVSPPPASHTCVTPPFFVPGAGLVLERFARLL